VSRLGWLDREFRVHDEKSAMGYVWSYQVRPTTVRVGFFRRRDVPGFEVRIERHFIDWQVWETHKIPGTRERAEAFARSRCYLLAGAPAPGEPDWENGTKPEVGQ